MPATQMTRATPAAKNQSSSRDSSASKFGEPKPEPAILFQNFFKSGPRTYAAQVKEASNGNHFLVLTDGKRDPKTDELRKSRVFVFAEDFPAFFRMLHETAQFIKANPVPESVRQRREAYRAKSQAQRTGNSAARA
jgi:hypothetical protein